MKMQSFRAVSPWLGSLVFVLFAVPAFSQVPQHTTFTGRLVDNLGDPLAGPVNLELRIFDAAAGPTQLYSEEHLSVALDAIGAFSVQLGLGTSPSGTFGASLFSGVDRWLEVVVGAERAGPAPDHRLGALGADRAAGERDRAEPGRAIQGLRRRHGGGPPDGAAVGAEDRDVGGP